MSFDFLKRDDGYYELFADACIEADYREAGEEVPDFIPENDIDRWLFNEQTRGERVHGPGCAFAGPFRPSAVVRAAF